MAAVAVITIRSAGGTKNSFVRSRAEKTPISKNGAPDKKLQSEQSFSFVIWFLKGILDVES